jgi:hypothetical protein
MDDKQFDHLNNRLDLILKLLALEKLSGKTLTEQVSILTDFGFRPSEIAFVLNHKIKDITSLQARIKRRSEKK